MQYAVTCKSRANCYLCGVPIKIISTHKPIFSIFEWRHQKCRKHIIIPIVSQIRARSAEIVSHPTQPHTKPSHHIASHWVWDVGKIAVIKLVVNGTAKCCTIRRRIGRKPNASAGAARGAIRHSQSFEGHATRLINCER